MAQQRPILAASAAVFRGQFVLLVRRGQSLGQGLWSLPGGKVESGETAEAAALRELVEETGVSAALHGIAGVFKINDNERHYVITCFAGVHVSGEPQAASDAAEARFVHLSEVEGFVLAPNTAQAIAAARKLISF
jgi:8-oxo-dGTP diphosphatase